MLVRGALRRGFFLTVAQLKSVIAELQLGEAPGTKKVALAQHVIDKLFPEATEEEKAYSVMSIMARKPPKPEESPELLLKLTSMLDCREADHFNRMRKRAVDELELLRMKEKAHAFARDRQAEGFNEPRGSGVKRGHDDSDLPERTPKAPRAARDKDAHVEKLARSKVKAPPEFLQFFPLVSYAYFKWMPQASRVTVEFADKDRASAN